LMRVIYIAGPYRAETKAGIAHNIKHAREAAVKMWQEGYAVFCPHMNTAWFDGVVPDVTFLLGDIEILSRCDAIYLLKGFDKSVGARREYAVARKLKLEIIFEGLKEDF